jgi:hypothetical protein
MRLSLFLWSLLRHQIRKKDIRTGWHGEPIRSSVRGRNAYRGLVDGRRKTDRWRFRKNTPDTLGGTENTRVPIFCASTSHSSRDRGIRTELCRVRSGSRIRLDGGRTLTTLEFGVSTTIIASKGPPPHGHGYLHCHYTNRPLLGPLCQLLSMVKLQAAV